LAGNTTKVVFYIDKTAPTVSIKDQNNKIIGNNGTIIGQAIVKVSDNYLQSTTLKKDGIETSIPENGIILVAGKYEITAQDKAGNKSIFVFNIIINNEITSDILNVNQTNKYISTIPTGTTVIQFLSKVKQDNVQVYINNIKVSGDTLLSTNATVNLMSGNTVINTYTIILTGDINGDGKINISDMIVLKSQLLNQKELSNVYAKAADTNGDGKLNITDFIQLKSHIIGKSTITPRSY